MIRSLQSFRGLFALAIFATHCSEFLGLDFVLWGGDAGVVFFFILSGFVLTLGYSDRISAGHFRYHAYALRRLIRFFPLHISLLVLYILTEEGRLSLIDYIHLVPNALLLQSWSPNPDVYFSGNAPSWALSDLLFFAAVFPMLVKCRCRHPRLCLFLFAVVIAAYPLYLHVIPSDSSLFPVYIFPAVRLLDFAIGMLLADLYRRLRARYVTTLSADVLQPLAILVLAVAVWAYGRVPDEIVYASLWWLPVGTLTLIFSLTDGRGVIARVLSSKPLVMLGDISFAFYLIHVPVLRFLLRILQPLHPATVAPFFFVASLVLILVLSWVVWRYFERPVSNFLLRRFVSPNSGMYMSEKD